MKPAQFSILFVKFHTIIIPDFLSFVKDATTPSIIVPLPYQISTMPLHSKKKKKTALFAILGYFAVILAFSEAWLRQVMLCFA